MQSARIFASSNVEELRNLFSRARLTLLLGCDKVGLNITQADKRLITN